MALGFIYTLPTIVGIHSDFRVVLKTIDFPPTSIDASGGSLASGGGEIKAYTSTDKLTQLPIDIVTLISSATVPNAEVYIKTTAETGGTIYIEKDEVQVVQPAASSIYGSESVWVSSAFNLHLEDNNADSSGNLSFSDIGVPVYNVASKLGDGASFAQTDGIIPSTVAAITPSTGYRFGFWGNHTADSASTGDYSYLINQAGLYIGRQTTNFAVFHGGDTSTSFDQLASTFTGLGLSRYDFTWDSTSRFYFKAFNVVLK